MHATLKVSNHFKMANEVSVIKHLFTQVKKGTYINKFEGAKSQIRLSSQEDKLTALKFLIR